MAEKFNLMAKTEAQIFVPSNATPCSFENFSKKVEKKREKGIDKMKLCGKLFPN
ncbi:MAG: hypothetical protein ACI4QL_03005 [Candidatus Fimimonas sp.]